MHITPQAEQDYTVCAMKVSTILPQSPLLPPQHMHTHIQYREISRLRQLLAEREKNKIRCTLQNNIDSTEESEEEPSCLNLSKCGSKRKALEEDLQPTKKIKQDQEDSDYTLVSY